MYWAKNELQNTEDIKHIKHLSPWSKTATWKFRVRVFFKSLHNCLTIKFIYLYLNFKNSVSSDCWDEAVLWNLRRWDMRLVLLRNMGALLEGFGEGKLQKNFFLFVCLFKIIHDNNMAQHAKLLTFVFCSKVKQNQI